jgi:hypothetical protein
MAKLTAAQKQYLVERYVGGMGGLSEEAYACAPDVLMLLDRVKELETALKNVRRLTITKLTKIDKDIASHLLRFCSEADITGDILRED